MAVASILCYGPRRLVATQPQYSLQPQRADARLLTREIRRRSQPYLQRRAGLVENRTRRHGALKTARPANEPCSVGPIWIIPATAARTNKALRPAQAFEVPQAVDFTGEPVFELAPRPGIVLTGNWLMLGFARAAIMAQVELNG